MEQPKKIIAMCPVHTAGLPKHVKLPTPSIEHTIKPCDRCRRDCWIGPAQLLMKTMTGAEALCYWCLVPLTKYADIELTSLDASADTKLRRTT